MGVQHEIIITVRADPERMRQVTFPGSGGYNREDCDPPTTRWDDLTADLRHWLGDQPDLSVLDVTVRADNAHRRTDGRRLDILT